MAVSIQNLFLNMQENVGSFGLNCAQSSALLSLILFLIGYPLEAV